MVAHRRAGALRIMRFGRRQDALVMKLPAFRAAIHAENSYALLPQNSYDGIEQRQHQGIRRSLGQRQVKIQVRLDVRIGIVQVAIHCGDCLAHGRQ